MKEYKKTLCYDYRRYFDLENLLLHKGRYKKLFSFVLMFEKRLLKEI